MSLPPQRTAKWHDAEHAPDNWSDEAALLRTIRKARNARVDFNWRFSREDLVCVREAVHEWGHRVTGRYREFDSKMLRAINEGLADGQNAYTLVRRSNAPTLDADVRCYADPDFADSGRFAVEGWAPFDIVFGYGFGDGPMHPATAVRLPVHVARYLTNSIEELGWSQNKIMDPQFRRVLNVLFGFGVNSGAAAQQGGATKCLEKQRL